MNLSKSYYLVKFQIFNSEQDIVTESEELFNDFSQPIRFRRENALKYFYDLIAKNNCDVTFYFVHPDYNLEFYNGRLEEFELTSFRENLLFRVNKGVVSYNVGLWTAEYKHYQDNAEVNFNKLVKVRDGEFQHPVYSDEICKRLGITFDYYEFE
jgi:hypothetical protein